MRDGLAESPEIHAAYRHCEQVTRTQARNFSYGIRLLPAPKRRALSAVYAFARRIDDIGDGTLPAADKLAALAEVRAQLTELAGDRAQAVRQSGQVRLAGQVHQPEPAGLAGQSRRLNWPGKLVWPGRLVWLNSPGSLIRLVWPGRPGRPVLTIQCWSPSRMLAAGIRFPSAPSAS